MLGRLALLICGATLLARSVAPGLIVGGENPQVTSLHKLLVVHLEEWVRGGEKLWVEHNLQSGGE